MVWQKATFIRKHLERYHYFVFIDSDALFEDISKRIEVVLVPLFSRALRVRSRDPEGLLREEEACIIVGEDCWEPGACWHQHELNTGFIVAKNKPETFDFLHEWSAGYMEDHGLCAHLRYSHPREQACMTLLTKRPDMQGKVYIVPATENLVGQRFSTYVRHLAGMTRAERLHILRGRAHDI